MATSVTAAMWLDGEPRKEEKEEEEEDEVWEDALEVFPEDLEDSLEWPLHRAAFYGDAGVVARLAGGMSWDTLKRSLDPQGHTALHVAVLRQNRECVSALLAAGMPAASKDRRGWTPVYQAAQLRDKEVVKQLLLAELEQSAADVKRKKAAMLAKLAALPDFRAALRWEISSAVPGVGYLLRSLAPHDTYAIWKQGDRVRIDGTLMGLSSKGLLPEWKRRPFSLLYRASGGGPGGRPLCAFVDRGKSRWADLQAARKRLNARANGAAVERDADELLAPGPVGQVKVRASKWQFAPATTWLGRGVQEKVAEWDTCVYEASTGLMRVTRRKAPCSVPRGATWAQYLLLSFEEDDETSEPIDVFSAGRKHGKGGRGKADGEGAECGGKRHGKQHAKGVQPDGPTGGSGRACQSAGSACSRTAAAPTANDDDKHPHAKHTRQLTSKCWMASGFPLSLHQLLPLLEAIGTANKPIARVAKFMSRYGNMGMFPVQVHVPIAFTAYVNLQFSEFKLMEQQKSASSPAGPKLQSDMLQPVDFFEIPPDFVQFEPKALEKMEKMMTEPDDDEEALSCVDEADSTTHGSDM